jgi:hypothetical protein
MKNFIFIGFSLLLFSGCVNNKKVQIITSLTKYSKTTLKISYNNV